MTRLVRVDNGQTESIGRPLTTRATAPGEVMRHQVSVQVIGTMVRFQVDGGSPRVAFAAAPAAGRIGVLVGGGAGCTARFENLTLTLPR